MNSAGRNAKILLKAIKKRSWGRCLSYEGNFRQFEQTVGEAIATYLDVPLTQADVRRFADMEVFVEIHENVRGEDVFVVQSTSYPANDHVMELLVTLDALRRGSARRITAVLPYYGYARQDRKSGPRTPISAKLLPI